MKNKVPSNMVNLHAFLVKAASIRQATMNLDSRFPMHMEVEKKGMFIAKGAFRSAYLMEADDGTLVVVKLVNWRNDSGFTDRQVIDSNEHELHTYETILDETPELAPLVLAPLAFWSMNEHDVIVFPVVKTIREYGDEWIAMRCAPDSKMRQGENLLDSIFSDTHHGNIGIWNDLPVMIDYGHDGVSPLSDTHKKKISEIYSPRLVEA